MKKIISHQYKEGRGEIEGSVYGSKQHLEMSIIILVGCVYGWLRQFKVNVT